MGGFQIAAYEQGNLDGLCAFYSIINAIALAAARAQANGLDLGRIRAQMARQRVDELFATLAGGTPSLQRQTGDAVVNGINSAQMSSLLKLANKWLLRRYDVRLLIQRPFYRNPEVTPKNLSALIDISSRRGASAIIVGGREPWNHWSVAERVSKRGIHLLDSSHYSLVSWRKLPKGRAPDFGLLVPQAVIVLSLVDAV